jgi:hypothetical protein
MILFILLQIFPIGLTGENHKEPLYYQPGPRNIVLLKPLTPKDSTSVKKDTIRLERPIKIKTK